MERNQDKNPVGAASRSLFTGCLAPFIKFFVHYSVLLNSIGGDTTLFRVSCPRGGHYDGGDTTNFWHFAPGGDTIEGGGH